METYLRIIVPIYFGAFSFTCFVWRILVFKKENGINPLVLRSSDSPMGYVSFLLKVTAVMTAFSVGCFVVCPTTYLAHGFFEPLNRDPFKFSGFVLFAISLLLTASAQIQMGKSWRVGIDTKIKTDLVRHGVYRFSRNPIYLGIMLTLLGFFLVLPNRLNLAIMLFAFSILGVLIRLEEEHMRSLHPEEFGRFCKEVRRWV